MVLCDKSSIQPTTSEERWSMSKTAQIPCCRHESGCKGILDEKNLLSLRTGCYSSRSVFPCTICGRISAIETVDGNKVAVGMNRRSGEEVYLENDKLVFKDPSEVVKS